MHFLYLLAIILDWWQQELLHPAAQSCSSMSSHPAGNDAEPVFPIQTLAPTPTPECVYDVASNPRPSGSKDICKDCQRTFLVTQKGWVSPLS